MTSVATQPAQTQADPELNKPSKTSTQSDIPVPPEEDFDDGETVVESPETENKFRGAMDRLREAIEDYNGALEQKADEKTIEKKEQRVVQALKEAAESSPNPKVKEYYQAKALEFMRVGRTAKKVLTNDIIKGVLFILASPVALLSSVVVSTGGLVYGLGSVVKGVGDLMSGMTFSGTVLGSKDEPAAKKKSTDAGVQKDGEEEEENKEGEDPQGEEKDMEGGEEKTENQEDNTVEREANATNDPNHSININSS